MRLAGSFVPASSGKRSSSSHCCVCACVKDIKLQVGYSFVSCTKVEDKVITITTCSADTQTEDEDRLETIITQPPIFTHQHIIYPYKRIHFHIRLHEGTVPGVHVSLLHVHACTYSAMIRTHTSFLHGNKHQLSLYYHPVQSYRFSC